MSAIVQLRAGTAAEWAAANPILADREIGVEKGTLLWKMGDGVTHWNDLLYRVSNAMNQVALFNGQAAMPASPAAGQLNVFAKTLGGRMLLRMQGPTGLSTPLQPSFFQNQIYIISTNITTTLTTLGMNVTSVGTISHPAYNEDYGYMANFASNGTAAGTCGTSFNVANLWRGATLGKSNGFFLAQRLAFPDAAYTQSGVGTGSRIFAGVTSLALSAQVVTDSPVASYIGLVRYHTDAGRQDANWQVISKDGTTQSILDTGMLFRPLCVYDIYLFAPPASDRVYWRVDNITTGETAEGVLISPATVLPAALTLLRAGFQVYSVDAVVRNVRMQRLYCESDR